MHPDVMIALADEVQRDRESAPQRLELRSLALANRAPGFHGSHAASRLARRLLAATSLRPRLT
jgi:hypothetical protein